MRRFVAVLICMLSASVMGCTSDNNSDISSSRAVDIELQDRTLQVGEGTVLQVDFSFDTGDVLNGNDNVVVTVRLPAGLSLRSGTSEIDGGSNSDDEGVGAQITQCSNGDTFLVYDLDRFDLDKAANPSGDADARLKLTIDADDIVRNGIIEARADSSAFFTCDGLFLSDVRTGINVL